MKKVLISLLSLFSFVNSSYAHELGIYGFGISAHIASGTSSATSRKIDEKGIFIFNPGAGLSYDFRDKNAGGFSFILFAGTYQDCGKNQTYVYGPGVRYRYYATKNFSLDAELIAAGYTGRDWGPKYEEANTEAQGFQLGVKYPGFFAGKSLSEIANLRITKQSAEHLLSNNLTSEEVKKYLEEQLAKQNENPAKGPEQTSIIPLPSIVLNYKITDEVSIGYRATVAPPVKGQGSLGCWLIFNYVYVGISYDF